VWNYTNPAWLRMKAIYWPNPLLIQINRVNVLSKIGDALGLTDNILSFQPIAALIGPGTTLAHTATGISVAVLVLNLIINIINWINAWEAGDRLYGFRAVAYTITAWAFDETIPSSSNRYLKRAKEKTGAYADCFAFLGEEEKRWHKAWKEASNAAVKRLDKLANDELMGRKSTLKKYLRFISNDNKEDLCSAVLKGMEKKLDDYQAELMRHGYDIKYPH